MGSDLGGRLIQSLKWCMYDAGMKSRMDGMLAWCCFYKSGGRIIPFPFFLSFFLSSFHFSPPAGLAPSPSFSISILHL